MVKKQIEDETNKVRKGFTEEMLSPTTELADLNVMPREGMTHDDVLKLTKEYLGCGKFNWKDGTFSGTVYNGNDVLTELMTKVYGLAAWTNPLHPDAFPGIRKMEAEIVRMCCDLFHVSNYFGEIIPIIFQFGIQYLFCALLILTGRCLFMWMCH